MTRFFDIIFSLLGLIILSPLFFIVSLWIMLTSKGYPIYSQQRIGRNGKEFLLFKFRSMHINADKVGLLLTIGGRDPRITKVGYFLRKYKLDELPQLWNVLKGEMSIVGPRPEVKKYVDLYTDYQKKILEVRPGITDMASLKFRNENVLLAAQADPEAYYIKEIIPTKIKLNQVFMGSPSIGNYFYIILKTIQTIII